MTFPPQSDPSWDRLRRGVRLLLLRGCALFLFEVALDELVSVFGDDTIG